MLAAKHCTSFISVDEMSPSGEGEKVNSESGLRDRKSVVSSELKSRSQSSRRRPLITVEEVSGLNGRGTSDGSKTHQPIYPTWVKANTYLELEFPVVLVVDFKFLMSPSNWFHHFSIASRRQTVYSLTTFSTVVFSLKPSPHQQPDREGGSGASDTGVAILSGWRCQLAGADFLFSKLKERGAKPNMAVTMENVASGKR